MKRNKNDNELKIIGKELCSKIYEIEVSIKGKKNIIYVGERNGKQKCEQLDNLYSINIEQIPYTYKDITFHKLNKTITFLNITYIFNEFKMTDYISYEKEKGIYFFNDYYRKIKIDNTFLSQGILNYINNKYET